MFCNSCGASLPQTVRFCTSCGAPVQKDARMAVEVRSAIDEEHCKNTSSGEVSNNSEQIVLPPLQVQTKKKSWIPLILVIVVIIGIGVFLAVKPEQNSYIEYVQSGSPLDYPDRTYGEAFHNFFGYPKWRHFKSTENQDIVEFTGRCLYADVEVDVLIQFILYLEESEFEMAYLSFNDVPQNLLVMSALISVIFEEP